MSKPFVIKLKLAFLVSMFLFLSSSLETCTARQGKRHGRHSRSGTAGIRQENTILRETNKADKSNSIAGVIFNVLNYGAKGDGRTDDSKAFSAAWDAACKTAGSTMEVPTGSVFLVGPISFSGSCAPNITFQLDGKIIAPTSVSAWRARPIQWIEFTKLDGITIKGTGIIDGQGSAWWNNDEPSNYSSDESASSELKADNMPSTKPTALRFYGSNGVIVTGITIQNSQQTHLKFDSCTNIRVFSFTASSPGDSPNTDGIHLQNTQDVIIYGSSLACGDDCISIQTGCSKVYIHDVNCGPGHGISISGLGKEDSKACVSNITVQNVSMHNTLNGVRIKTWQGGSGSVQEVTFSNIQVSQVQTPIVIDQYYCDGKKCKNQTSAVDVSNINFINIRGTYTVQPVYFACSDSSPCSGVSLASIQLTSENNEQSGPFCWKTYGQLKTQTVPPIGCLQTGNPSNGKTQSHSDSCEAA
ncbi:hypothetical protein ACFE04_006882 [Oxalis oulophora]